jgi:hypothetical protein
LELFHEAFFEPEDRLGLRKPDVMTEESLRSRAQKLHASVNASLQEQRERIESPAPAPELYFDFIDSKLVNAHAKELKGVNLFGLHGPSSQRCLKQSRECSNEMLFVFAALAHSRPLRLKLKGTAYSRL